MNLTEAELDLLAREAVETVIAERTDLKTLGRCSLEDFENRVIALGGGRLVVKTSQAHKYMRLASNLHRSVNLIEAPSINAALELLSDKEPEAEQGTLIDVESERQARQAVEAADAQIAQLCRSFGIPEEFRPGLNCNWYARGENAEKQRRAELRAVAQREVAARVQTAKVTVDRHAAALLCDLTANGLETEHAKAFLEQLPSIDDLMPRLLGLSEVETLALSFGKEHARLLGLSA